MGLLTVVRRIVRKTALGWIIANLEIDLTDTIIVDQQSFSLN